MKVIARGYVCPYCVKAEALESHLVSANALAEAARPFTTLLVDGGNTDDVDVAPWNFIRAGDVRALIIALRQYEEVSNG